MASDENVDSLSFQILVDLMCPPKEKTSGPPLSRQDRIIYAISNAQTHQRWRVLIPLFEELEKQFKELLDAPHQDHIASRLNNHEAIAFENMKVALNKIREARKQIY